MWTLDRNRKLSLTSYNKQQGLAMVEMAIITPLLLFLLFAVAEMGRTFYQYNTLTKSVRDGARYLAVNAIRATTGVIDLTDDKITATKNVVMYGDQAGAGDLIFAGLTADAIEVTPVDAVHIQVSISYPYQSMFGGSIPSFGFGDGDIDTTYTLVASSVMRTQ